jgi:hypothetical protein
VNPDLEPVPAAVEAIDSGEPAEPKTDDDELASFTL